MKTENTIHIEFILTYFVGEQEFIKTTISFEQLQSEETLKELILEQLTEEQRELLVKVSCCAYAELSELPDWYMQANGKLWFNDDKRAQYGLS